MTSLRIKKLSLLHKYELEIIPFAVYSRGLVAQQKWKMKTKKRMLFDAKFLGKLKIPIYV